MSILSALKKAPTSVSPHRAALDDFIARRTALHEKRARLQAKELAAHRDEEAAAAHAVTVAALRDAIDQTAAEARYSGVPADGLDARRRELAQAESEGRRLSDIARPAAIARARYLRDLDAINAQLQELNAASFAVIYSVIREDLLPAFSAEFLAVEAKLREIHKAAFIVAAAADRLAVEARGEFSGSALVHELRISRPNHPAFAPAPVGPGEFEFGKEIDAAADALIHRVATGAREI